MTTTKIILGEHDYAIIMAGGRGTRLWPLSKKDKPKQFHAILGNKSPLQLMYNMLRASFEPDHIFIQSSQEYKSLIKKQISGIKGANIIIEPEARDTAPAFAFAAATMLAQDPQAVLGFFYSDHAIQNEDAFNNTIHTCFKAVSHLPDHLALIGVWPTDPNTGLGYMEIGRQKKYGDQLPETYSVKSFVEKPDIQLANKLVASKRYLWNTGCKFVRAHEVIRFLSDSDTKHKSILPRLVSAIKKNDDKKIKSLFLQLPRESFEYVVAEKAKKLLLVASDMVWSDIGDWSVIHDLLTKDRIGKLYTAGRVEEHGCTDTLLISHCRPIIAVGIKNMIVVETKSAVLVMSKGSTHEIKKVLARLFKNNSNLE